MVAMDAEISSHAVSDPRQRIAAVLCVALEVLWLIAVVAVPLAAAPPDAMIGHFEVPKVAVLRVLSFAIGVVWLVDWMVRPPHVWPRLPRVSATGLRSWLKRDPSNWITLTLGIYLVANIVSAATSVSPAVSVWGKRPGWDGYDLYAMLCYTALYLVIVTHLRSPSQAWRLIGALVVTGTTVGIYIILQYLGLDPYLAKGSALTRPYGTLGNPVFAGAVLVMTTTVTVAAGFALIERFRSYLVACRTGRGSYTTVVGHHPHAHPGCLGRACGRDGSFPGPASAPPIREAKPTYVCGRPGLIWVEYHRLGCP